jgi:hypothetical protein
VSERTLVSERGRSADDHRSLARGLQHRPAARHSDSKRPLPTPPPARAPCWLRGPARRLWLRPKARLFRTDSHPPRSGFGRQVK